jgi:hypothetical protein
MLTYAVGEKQTVLFAVEAEGKGERPQTFLGASPTLECHSAA